MQKSFFAPNSQSLKHRFYYMGDILYSLQFDLTQQYTQMEINPFFSFFFFHFSMPRIKHYKVISVGKNYTIELEKPVSSCFLVDEFSFVSFQTYLTEYKERQFPDSLPGNIVQVSRVRSEMQEPVEEAEQKIIC